MSMSNCYRKIQLQFQIGYSDGIDIPPTETVPAVVPGAVQLDWARAHEYPPYYHGENWKMYQWMEDVFWHYSAALNILPAKGERVILCSKGIDYQYRIRVGEQIIYEYEGMFRHFSVDLTPYLTGNDMLYIDLYPVPKREGTNGRSQASASCKPAVSYGWDWHPRLIPLGIWDDIWIEIRKGIEIKYAEFSYKLQPEQKKADFMFEFESSEACFYRFEILSPKNKSIYVSSGSCRPENTRISGHLSELSLWWPNGYGEQPLYRVRLETESESGGSCVYETRVGFRKSELVMHEGAWETPDKMPKSRSNPPITMQINGRKIFCKGSNWVPPQIFYGCITENEYRTLLTMAKEANFNMLRVWGGGIVNKDVFYDICDEMGLMVWQEFPLTCNNYSDDPRYLSVLDQESRAIIQRLKGHACLTLWCGGNELFNKWSGMTEQSRALRLLNKNCYILDQDTPFIMTSPLSGMAHGGYHFREPDGREVYEVINSSNNTAYTEFGVSSVSDESILSMAIPPDELFPPKLGTSWVSHHGLQAFYEDCWTCMGVLEYYFGPIKDLNALIKNSSLLQCEGLKAVFEEARRQQPVCSMALSWNFNETWPTAAGNHIVTWDHRPKPAYAAVRDALRPAMVSAKNVRFLWRPGQTFESELWALNDSFVAVEFGEVSAVLTVDGVELTRISWHTGVLSPQTNRRGPTCRAVLPDLDAAELVLTVFSSASAALTSVYRFRLVREEKAESKVAVNLNQ